ncbi:MAG: hypothetical protein P8Y69_05815 [Gammaproteobacteria bacterium]
MRGLIEHEQRGLMQEARHDVQPALHTARQRVDAVVRAVLEATPAEGVVDAGLQISRRHPHHATEYRQVLASGQVGIQGQLLRDEAECGAYGRIPPRVATRQSGIAAVGRNASAGGAEQRRLAGPVGAEQHHQLAGADGEAHVFQHLSGPEGLVNACQREQRFAQQSPSRLASIFD